MHSAHHITYFEIIYGYYSDFTIPIGPPTNFPALNLQLQQLQETHKEANVVLQMEKCAIKQSFKAHKPPPITFC